MRVNRLITLFIFFLTSQVAAQQKTYLIPVLHGLHKTNQAYNYDSLKAIISRLKPDVIAVEIRPEDIGSDTTYLKKNYPLEMWTMPFWFPQARMAGFDWLGEDIRGKAIPENYWKEQAAIKKWERRLNKDSLYAKKLAVCDTISKTRLEILKTSSLRQILESRDSELVKQYYTCLETSLEGSEYQQITDFYSRRNRKMVKNLKQLRRELKGKVLVIITGDDHYPYLFDALKPDSLVSLK